jgi:hypothetical protein
MSGEYRLPGLRRTSGLDEIERLQAELDDRRRVWAEEQERVRVRSVVASDPRAVDRCRFHAAFVAAIDCIHEETIDGVRWTHSKIATALGVSAGQMSRMYNHGDKELGQLQGWVMPAIRRALPVQAWDAFIDAISEWRAPSSRRVAHG